MMYRVARTEIPGESRRPFSQRLGLYVPGELVVPSWSNTVYQRAQYPFLQSPFKFRAGASSVPLDDGVTLKPGGGMGAMDFGALTSNPLFWLAAAAGGFWLYRKYGR